MEENLQTISPHNLIDKRLILALDFDNLRKVRNTVATFTGLVGMFKVGKELFVHAGPSVVKSIHKLGGEVFLDLKFHDIPTTVAKAALQATRLGVKMFNVHASGGLEMMSHTAKEVERLCQKEHLRRPIMLAVTVLTSINGEELSKTGIGGTLDDQVLRLAALAQEAGMDGVVASPQEVTHLRLHLGEKFTIVTPGVRPKGQKQDDQKRVTTPSEAIQLGADYLVIGRPILGAHNPLQAARNIIKEMEQVEQTA